MLPLFDPDAKNVLYGVILIALSVIFLLSSLGFFRSGHYIIGQEIDFLIAFAAIIIGCAMVFSSVRKGK